jgi:hypothetical protein
MGTTHQPTLDVMPAEAGIPTGFQGTRREPNFEVTWIPAVHAKHGSAMAQG